jgi:hypothetical protein
MAAGTMKIDDPTIVPTLIIVASSRPSWGWSPSCSAPAVEDALGMTDPATTEA